MKKCLVIQTMVRVFDDSKDIFTFRDIDEILEEGLINKGK